MMETFRSFSRSWAFRFFILLLAGTFVYFYAGARNGGGSKGFLHNGTTAATVNERKITLEEFQHAVDQTLEQYSKMAGGQVPEQFKGMVVQQTLQQMIAMELVQEESQHVGLATSDQELAEKIMDLPYFKVDGHFDAERYHRFNQASRFEDKFRDDLTAEKYRRFLSSAIVIDEDEAKADYLASAVKVDVQVVTLDPVALTAKIPIDDKSVKTYIESHSEDLKKQYEQTKAVYTQKEQVKARHILIRAPESATAEESAAAADKMQKIYAQAKAKPQDFAKLAKQYSEDPGSQKTGGDLGFFGRGQMTPKFEETAFTLKKGEISQPFRTPFGFHIMIVEDRIDAVTKPYEQVQAQMARQTLALAKADLFAKDLAQSLNRQLQQGKNIDATLKNYGLAWTERKDVSLRSSPFGSDSAAMTLTLAALTLTPKHAVLDQPLLAGKTYYLMKLKNRKDADLATFEKSRAMVMTALQQRYGSRLLSNWVDYLKKNAHIQIADSLKQASENPVTATDSGEFPE